MSINFNTAANQALRTLQASNKALDATQNRISTGLKISEAKDNAAYWSISTVLKSDNKAMATVSDALGLGSATVDTAYQGLNAAKDVLNEIKSKLTAASQDGVNKDVIQSEISELQKQLKSIAGSSIFSGENWLSVDSSNAAYSSSKNVVASFARDAEGAVTIGTIGVDISSVALFDGNVDPTKKGIIDGLNSLTTASGRDLSYGGVVSASSTGNTSTAGLVKGTDTGTTAAALTDAGAVMTRGETALGGAFASAAYTAGQGLAFTFNLITTDATTGAQTATPTTLQVLDSNFSAVGDLDATADSLAEVVAAFNNAATGAATYEAYLDGSSMKIRNKTGGELFGVQMTSIAAVAGGSTLGLTTPDTTVHVGAGNAKVQSTSLNISGLNATDKVTFSMKFDGGPTQTFTATKGTGLSDLVASLNGATGFSTYGVASVNGSELVITGKTTGADKSIELTGVTYSDTLNNTIELATATNLPYSEKAKVVSAAFAGPISLDADDKIQFDIAVNGGSSKLVTIDKATVDAALSVNTGTIGTAANYVSVLNKALTQAGVTGVSASIETVGADAGKVVFTSDNRGASASVNVSNVAATKGAMEISIDSMDISAEGLKALGADTGDKARDVISAYVSIVNSAINKITDAASNLGSVSSRIDLQKTFVQNLMDTIDKGVSGLVDADMNEESTKLQALQVKQSLGVQALSIANQSAQNVLRLFQ